MTARPRTIMDKIWDDHVVAELDDGTSLIYIDRILLHDRSGGLALRALTDEGRSPLDRNLVFGTMDHVVDTRPNRDPSGSTPVPSGAMFINAFREQALQHQVSLFDVDDDRQGISHVVFPEQGIALPGTTMICCDSHTPTLGAMGALAWGVGVTDCEHALATQTLAMRRPANMLVSFDGPLGHHVYAKDLNLALLATIGANGATGHAIEFRGQAVSSLDVEGRLTLCNMATEAGASTAVIAPDDTLLDYLAGRPYAPSGDDWAAATYAWQRLASDPDAVFARTAHIGAAALAPHVTWGTSPAHGGAVDTTIPDPADTADPAGTQQALRYMGLLPGTPLAEIAIDAAYIGSCTNARLSDLRVAAEVLRGHTVADGVTALCVPGSTAVRHAAEAEGIDKVFIEAGFQWRESGCGMCFYAGGDRFPPGSRVASTTNRNFENRQGPGVRTHLASPATVAASAITGRLTDPRQV
ncbi:3-isopropylmalate dehydratase large subunit [Mycobacterium montefiorense]|uniref:(2R,3S)-2-methylisocitrate dehydratase n=1 Tax=Mycobacterium montefiorense TaxID=154654 RepID=A0AA37UMC1_9MYCO|nr:3-isopropylmalate dehydratase large subunit [Mycobacterium montefiorense]GBG38351.1 3-isopropylmalate dehydratase large subunit 1 [Mycobacterium montefiorense]GKU34180.1 3-isopropylmalate dehydratase large subunit 1 [Mycobacterium montefiorense]GKU38798.1 3-isopropylmalate dehydratase large subunit 1 [Mycobacterium montefiorense]GKU48165.1 3-isopropylmalate dehydratase large subunit 1 [Mycobacterium montefiorense]GKU49562.1 3-isopropylmalate dehydratase large subunit 1 [Mycobacterium montef